TSTLVGANFSAKFLSAIIPVKPFVIASLPLTIGEPGVISTALSAYAAEVPATSLASAALVHAASTDRITPSSTARGSAAAGGGVSVGVELQADSAIAAKAGTEAHAPRNQRCAEAMRNVCAPVMESPPCRGCVYRSSPYPRDLTVSTRRSREQLSTVVAPSRSEPRRVPGFPFP